MPQVVKRSKKYRERAKLLDREKKYSLAEALKEVKKINGAKYDETLSLNFQLGIKQGGEETIRGTVGLPYGSGQSVRVICVCKGESAREAKEAGANEVGGEELIAKIQGGWLEFDALVAHPDMMRELSKLGKVLGPKGLMPTPKTGTVTPNVAKAVKELKAGRIEFKSDKTSGLHAIVGKLSFSEEAILENARTVIRAIQDAKPAAAKGGYLKSITLASTQGPGFRLALSSL